MATKGTKLHEILAIESDVANTAKSIMDEAVVTFTKKTDHFAGATRTVTMIDEARSTENTSEEKPVVTTVPDKLAYVGRAVTKFWDTVFTKDLANQNACADLIVNGETLATAVPATWLLGMETKLKAVREMVQQVPTLNPSVSWEPDPVAGKNRWRSKQIDTKFRTEKTVRHKVLYDATKEHPAQIERWNEDVPVGRIEIRSFSGMISPAEKSALLARIDTMIRAVKKARQRANSVEVGKEKIAETLWNYMFSAT